MTENLLIAFVAACGVIAGSVATAIGQVALACYVDYRARKKDEKRRRMLQIMLEDDRFEWRNLDTLRHVIGTDAQTAKQLLLEIDARASEDGQDLWGLRSRHPLGLVNK